MRLIPGTTWPDICSESEEDGVSGVPPEPTDSLKAIADTVRVFDQSFSHLRWSPPLVLRSEDGPVTNEGTASMAGEIKSLAHWRRLDEVAGGSGVEVAPPTYDEFVAALSAAEPRRFFLVRVERPAYAPFPAGALCDRPWDISALVEE